MLIKAQTLNKMFRGNRGREHINCDGKCFGCGGIIKITVSRTSGGFGFQNGVLCETEAGQLLLECEHCLKSGKELNSQQDYELNSVDCG
jgi:hypothetical protein